jgi:hypothetical protein
MDDVANFLQARDFLLAHRTDYELAYRHFSWPRLDEFNWALDYFDVMAAGNTRPALWVVDETGREVRLSFAELSERSSRIAQFLRALGVRRGDRILLMLGNEVSLWETLLAAFKLGAVVIPSATLLETEDLRDRLNRGAVRHAIVGSAQVSKFTGLSGDYTRICVGGRVAGWHTLEDAYRHRESFTPEPRWFPALTHCAWPSRRLLWSWRRATSRGRNWPTASLPLSGRLLRLTNVFVACNSQTCPKPFPARFVAWSYGATSRIDRAIRSGSRWSFSRKISPTSPSARRASSSVALGTSSSNARIMGLTREGRDRRE